MEPADADLHSSRPQGAGAVHHEGELVRLDANETDHAEAAIVRDLTGDAVRADARVGFVDRENLDVDVVAKRLGTPSTFAQCRTGRRANWRAGPDFIHWMT